MFGHPHTQAEFRQLSASYCPESWPQRDIAHRTFAYAPPAVPVERMARQLIKRAKAEGIHPADLWADWQQWEDDSAYALNVAHHIRKRLEQRDKRFSFTRKGKLHFWRFGRLHVQWSVSRD